MTWGGFEHYDCAIYALIVGKGFFDSLRMLSFVIHADSGCHYGASDGRATVTIKSGAPPFNISWENGDTTATSQRLHEGWNNVSISDASNCPLEDSVFISRSTLNVAANDPGANIFVYPNPAAAYLNIDLSRADKSVISIELITPEGKVHECPLTKSSKIIQMETSGLSNGIYYLKIRLSDQTSTYKKVIVVR